MGSRIGPCAAQNFIGQELEDVRSVARAAAVPNAYEVAQYLATGKCARRFLPSTVGHVSLMH